MVRQLILVAVVAMVGVLHTVVPDHWLPISLLAREHGWTRRRTARTAFFAGLGHVVTTLIIGAVVWAAGVAAAARYGRLVDVLSGVALVAFGAWTAVAALREQGRLGADDDADHAGHHHHDIPFAGDAAHDGDDCEHEHEHEHAHAHGHAHGGVKLAVRHRHVHRHADGLTHAHTHVHEPATAHDVCLVDEADPPAHEHAHSARGRTALLLVLGSSPMLEGIPAFFAASRFGAGLVAIMSAVFAAATIATYVGLSLAAADRLQRLDLGRWERYGEALSGAVIAVVGVVFLAWPVL